VFANSFGDSIWTHGSHRGWTTLSAFAAQALAVAALLVLPLIPRPAPGALTGFASGTSATACTTGTRHACAIRGSSDEQYDFRW
jgi:hypothetical protein